jgi:hypothetical protein
MAARKVSTLSMAGKVSVFAIAYDRQEPVYQAGEVVQGHLTMEVLDEIAVRGKSVIARSGNRFTTVSYNVVASDHRCRPHLFSWNVVHCCEFGFPLVIICRDL